MRSVLSINGEVESLRSISWKDCRSSDCREMGLGFSEVSGPWYRIQEHPGLHPISANLFGMFFVKLPQNRHPERSASQIDRVTQRLWRGAEEPVLSVAEGTSA